MTKVPVHSPAGDGYGLIRLVCDADHATIEGRIEPGYKRLRDWFTLADCQAWHEQALKEERR